MSENTKLIRNSTAEFLIFTGQAGEKSIEARYEDGTVWLTQKLMAELFEVTVPTINEHLKNIFATSELEADSVIRNFRITAADGKSYGTNHYSLDAVLSVGYRVNSVRATQFRQWATNVLRELILTLAMQGKLVPQNPKDLPASELLNQIQAEKRQLIKEVKIKKQDPPDWVKPEETPHTLPEGWVWTRLQSLFAIVTDGDHQPPPKAEYGVPFWVIGNINKGTISLDDCRHVPRNYYDSLDWGRRPSEGDILYTVTGSYGIPALVTQDIEFCVQRHVAIFKSVKSTPIRYLTHLLNSSYSYDYASSVATGIAQKTVPLTGLRKMPIPVPPKNQRRRIVAKIDQLMVLCDRLEQNIDAATGKQAELLNAVMAQL